MASPRTVHYKGFELSPSPLQLLDSSEWQLRVVVTKHHDSRNETLEKLFIGKNTFKTQKEAEVHAVAFGKQIIDGNFPEFTLNDLL